MNPSMLSGTMSTPYTPMSMSPQHTPKPQPVQQHSYTDDHSILQRQSIPFEPPDATTSHGIVYLLTDANGQNIIYKATHRNASSVSACAREQKIFLLIRNGTIVLPQSLMHFLSVSARGTFMSYTPNGTLHARITHAAQLDHSHPQCGSLTSSQVRQRLRWSLQIVRLARAFSRRDLDHGNWHPKNLLLDANDDLSVCGFSSVVQLGSRLFQVGDSKYSHHPTDREIRGEGLTPWAVDQVWCRGMRQRFGNDALPHEFGLAVALDSLNDGKRGTDIYATERRVCFSIACLIYFLMSGAEPHPVLFSGRRAKGHLTPSSGASLLSPTGTGEVLRDPEDPFFAPFHKLGSIVRLCWSGKVASVAVLFYMIIENCRRFADEMCWDMRMMDNLLGMERDGITRATFDKRELEHKKKICEEFAEQWKAMKNSGQELESR